jgi:chromosome segregation ATPase
MNSDTPPPPPDPSVGGAPPVDDTSSRKLVNPNLSGSLTADHAALQNDLVQAQELAADFQRQLAGKSNEHAQLKQIFEKTQADLAHLQAGIVELRAERHRLANEAMRVTAFQSKLAKVTAERDRLRIDLEVVLKTLASKTDEMTIALRDRERRIAELVVEMVGLRQAVAEAKGQVPAPAAGKSASNDEEESIEIVSFETHS